MTLKQQAVSGVKWGSISMGAVTVLQFVTLTALARVLSPSDFGLMGMVMVVIGFVQAFADIGISNAIIHRQNPTRNHLSSLYWLNILAGVIVFCLVCAFTPLVVEFYREPRLPSLLCLTAVIFLITPFGQQFQILLQKELRFNWLAKTEVVTAVTNTTVAIVSAFAGFGVYSIIFGQLAATCAKTALLCWVGWRQWHPSFHFAKRDLEGYLSFGLYQIGERTANYLSSNIDYIIVGRFLGSSALGFYTLAYQIAIFPLTKVNPIITKVMLPIFAKIQNDNSNFRRGYNEMMHYIALLSFPMMIGMSVVAPEFVTLFLGEKWVPCVSVLQILCLIGLLKSLGNPIGAVLLAKGRADIGLYCNIIAAIVVSIAVIIGVNWGIDGVALVILISQVPLFFIIQAIVNRLIGMRMIEYLKVLTTPLVCSTVMVLSVFFLKKLMGNMGSHWMFATTVIVGTMVYIVICYLKDKKTFINVATAIRGY
jgi:O-antigen/teichoic acid export membrane protein